MTHDKSEMRAKSYHNHGISEGIKAVEVIIDCP